MIPKPGAPRCGGDGGHRAAKQKVDMHTLREPYPILGKEGTGA